MISLLYSSIQACILFNMSLMFSYILCYKAKILLLGTTHLWSWKNCIKLALIVIFLVTVFLFISLPSNALT